MRNYLVLALRLRSGHILLNNLHIHMIKKKESLNYDLSDVIEDVYHILFFK